MSVEHKYLSSTNTGVKCSNTHTNVQIHISSLSTGLGLQALGCAVPRWGSWLSQLVPWALGLPRASTQWWDHWIYGCRVQLVSARGWESREVDKNPHSCPQMRASPQTPSRRAPGESPAFLYFQRPLLGAFQTPRKGQFSLR